MIGTKKLLIPLSFFSILNLLFIQSPPEKKSALDKIKVIASVFPLFEMARCVAGERGEVSLLVPPGAEVHTWQPRPSDILKINSADVFIYIGASLEPWLQDVLRGVSNQLLKVLEANRGFSLMKEEAEHLQKEEQGLLKGEHDKTHAYLDPHIWLDFGIDQKIVDQVEQTLTEIAPESRDYFQKNAHFYKEKLGELDEKYRESLSNCRLRTFIVGGHAAFGYLARRYNLQQVALYGLSPDSKPTPKQLIEVVELAKKYQIKVIYFEKLISNELARVVAKEVGAKTLVLNAGANITKDDLKSGTTFLEIMEKNLENLRDGLNCR